MKQWQAFTHDASGFAYKGDSLKNSWDELHAGDQVPYPDAQWVSASLDAYPDAAPESFDGDIDALAGSLQEAWRSFHSGRFAQAVELGNACGALGHAPANKAAGIYATYLENDEEIQRSIFLEASENAEWATTLLPDDANTHYFRAFNLGRYSQSVSVVEALRQGIGGKIKDSLSIALELSPRHAEAHTALGLYHAEIVDKIGKMIGKLTYGATPDNALAHFQQAVDLTPDAPIAQMEYGNGLYMLFGDKRLDEVTDLFIKASEMAPRDAMEYLDIEQASSELE